MTDALVVTAVANVTRWGISYWDGAILAAAGALGAPILYSEDLPSGRRYGDLPVVDPFVVE